MQYIEAPQDYEGNETSLFLAGGITDCPYWQRMIIKDLQDTSLVLLNPRRENFVMHKDAAKQQITWEHQHLRKATAILFWFPAETLCPIVLYELGAWSMTDKKLFVGTHPEYRRRQDVIIQTSLVRPDIEIASSVSELAEKVKAWSILE